MKTILIPLDGSQLAEEALDRGLDSVSKESTELVLFHAVDLNPMYASSGRLPMQTFLAIEQEEHLRHQNYLADTANKLAERGYTVRCQITSGDPVREILTAADSLPADTIVLTSHGRTGLSRFLVGGVAEGVLRRAKCPVVLQPSSVKLAETGSVEKEPSAPRKLLLPLDGSELSERTLAQLITEYHGEPVEVLLLHCIDINDLVLLSATLPSQTVELMETEYERWDSYLGEKVAELKEHGFSATCSVVQGRPVEQILQAAVREKVDLIVLASRGRSGLARLMLGSVAEGIARQARHPVMIVP